MRHTSMRTLTIACAALLICGTASQAAEEGFLPLAVGNEWEYLNTLNGAREVLTVAAVEESAGAQWYRIDIRKGAAKLVAQSLKVRLDLNRLLHWDPADPAGRLWADPTQPTNKPYVIYDPNGVLGSAINQPLSNRIVIRYAPICCDHGRLSETFERGVGLVAFEEDSFVGAQAWRLVRARINGRDIAIPK